MSQKYEKHSSVLYTYLKAIRVKKRGAIPPQGACERVKRIHRSKYLHCLRVSHKGRTLD